MTLAWAPGKSFTVDDRAPVTADTMADAILAAVRDQPGVSWTTIRKLVKGNADEAAKVRDRLIADGRLVNSRPERASSSSTCATTPPRPVPSLERA